MYILYCKSLQEFRIAEALDVQFLCEHYNVTNITSFTVWQRLLVVFDVCLTSEQVNTKAQPASKQHIGHTD